MQSSKGTSKHRRRASDDTITSSNPSLVDHFVDNLSKSRLDPQVVNLWVHDDSFSKEDVLINEDVFGAGTGSDTLLEVIALNAASDVRDFQEPSTEPPRRSEQAVNSQKEARDGAEVSKTTKADFDVDRSTRYLCKATLASPEITAKHATLQLSIASSIAANFGLRNRTQALVSIADETKNTASHVELAFRDAYISRSDMWRMVNAELAGKTVYLGQKIQFLGSIRATVKGIHIGNRKVTTALFSGNTVPVFRSEAARYVLFIQMSREMWDFDSEGNGEILFNRVINGFLPDLFERWSELEVKHLVSIVLFGRLVYDQGDPDYSVTASRSFGRSSSGVFPNLQHKDFYRVVVTDMASAQWTTILDELKKTFRVFLRDVCLEPTSLPGQPTNENDDPPVPQIAGRPTTALKGNMLEAINIAASQFASDYIDRDLVRTGVSVVVITAGSGVFEVDRDLLNLTSENLTNNGIGIDVVCLSKMPLHSAPLFKYRAAESSAMNRDQMYQSVSESPKTPHIRLASSLAQVSGTALLSSSTISPKSHSMSPFPSPSLWSQMQGWCYGIPQWIDLSYWSPDSELKLSSNKLHGGSKLIMNEQPRNKRFVPRVRMYELQMMGLMELGLADIAIPFLSERRRKTGKQRRSTNIKPPLGLGFTSESLSNSPTHLRKRLSKHVPPSPKAEGLLSTNAKQQGKIYDGMEEYDKELFFTSNQNKSFNIVAQLSRTKSLGSSLSGHRPSHSDEVRSTKEISTDNNVSFYPRSRAEADHGGGTGAKFTKTSTSKPQSGASRASRTISLAFKGFAPALRAVARTEVHTENAQAQPSKPRPTYLDRTLTSSSASIRSTQRPGSGTTAVDPSEVSFGSDQVDQPGSTTKPIAINTSARNQGRSGVDEVLHSHRLPSGRTREKDTSIVVEDESDKCSSSSDSDAPSERPSASASIPKPILPFIRNVNASNPIKRDPNAASFYGRWQHLYPRKPRAATVKWKSLCTPASVPLTTEEFPTLTDLETEFDSTTYSITQDSSNELLEVPQSRESLLQEMLSLRLSHGYQLVVQSYLTDSTEFRICSSPTFFKPTKLTKESDTIFLTMGNTIQKLFYSSDATVQVTRYVRKAKLETSFPRSINYLPYIRTILSEKYSTRRMELSGFSEEYPWELADGYLAGSKKNLYDAVQKLRFWRARFVLIPIDPPASAYKLAPSMNDENEEEIHLRGIRALTQIWQRNRYIPAEDRKFKPTAARKRDPNPLEIKFETLNPSEVVATEFDKLQTTEDLGEIQSAQLLPDSELLERETSSLSKVAQAMQSEKGIEIKNRRWHLRLHYNCFRGEDFINWILLNFKDIETREEAVEFGNELMDLNLFRHVNGKHKFKDGHFFYSVEPHFRASRMDSNKSWFPNSRRSDRSIPSTPMVENVSRESPLSVRSQSGSNLANEFSEKFGSEPKRSSTEKKRVSISLSKMIRLDVDHRRRSSRLEIINLHYDRLHNPENCYHLELSWLNVTSKLVEDAIASWATQSERYGLKLVEVPIAEASNISSYEPFRAPYRISLAADPPTNPLNFTPIFTATSFGPQPPPSNGGNKYKYQKALLKHFNFVLDLEATSEFPEDVDILYSWGKLEYRYTQFIHRSGVILAQITEDGDFLLLANRLYNNRYASAKDTTGKFADSTKNQPNRLSVQPLPHIQASGIIGMNLHNANSPAPSPLVRASADVLGTRALEISPLSTYITPEQIKDELESFCHDKDRLEAFYKEVSAAPPPQPRKSSSTSSSAMRPSWAPDDSTIPPMWLPPRLMISKEPSTSTPGLGIGGGNSAFGGRKVSPQTQAQAVEENGEVKDGPKRKNTG